MKTWKKYLTLGVVALLLVGAVYMNIKLSGGSPNVLAPKDGERAEVGLGIEVSGGEAPKDYFEAFRNDRDSTREKEFEYLEETIATMASDAESLADAQEAKLVLIDNIEKEFVMESLIKAKGFEDAAVMFRQGAVDVVVKAAELEPAEVAQILNIVTNETGVRAGNVNILPYG